MSFINNRIKAFAFAFSGLLQSFKGEIHLQLHALAALAVIALGIFYAITPTEWCVLLLCIALVICTEMINSAIERICNKLMPEKNNDVKYIKDVSAAAVLVASLVALVAGTIIFWPYFFG